MTTFSLDEKQEIQLKEWQEAIKKIYGEYGTYQFRFTPMGMGTSIEVYSELAKKALDLSNVEDW
jgi:hypothetical protein